jgi:hypothetical protein
VLRPEIAIAGRARDKKAILKPYLLLEHSVTRTGDPKKRSVCTHDRFRRDCALSTPDTRATPDREQRRQHVEPMLLGELAGLQS